MKKLRKLKKGLAILLTAAMVVGLVPGVGTMKVSAAGITPSKPSGEGTANSPYKIGTAAELYWFAALVNGDTTVSGMEVPGTYACAKLTDDIIVNTDDIASSYGNIKNGYWWEWTPIGKNELDGSYEGTFDGQGHTISGLFCSSYFGGSGATYFGLFGFNRGTIKNVGVVNSAFCGGSYSYTGGVCGQNAGTIENCYNTGTVTGTDYVGGVCGWNDGTIENCYNTGTVNGSSDLVGGVCGRNAGTIKNSYNTGTVTGTSDVGGMCGQNDSTIENSYNTGTVNGSSDVGGMCGRNDSTIENCYNAGPVNGSNQVGGVCGWLQYGTITNCYFDSEKYSGDAVGITSDGAVTNVVGKATKQFQSGEVAYLLNGSTSASTEDNPLVWYQNLDDGTADTSPVLDNTHGVVYQCTPCTAVYSNAPDKKVAHSYKVNDADDTKHTCENCGDMQEHSTSTLTYAVNSQTAETSSITVKCGDDCGKEYGTVTLSAPTGDLTYDGNAKAATVSNTVSGIENFTNPDITYKQGEDELSSAPKDAGTYTASITLGTGEGAATVSVEFTIARKPVTITANDASKTYEETDPALSFTVSEETPLVDDEALEGTLSREAGEDAGTYKITQGTVTNDTNPNYDITFNEGTFTINKAQTEKTAECEMNLVYDENSESYTATITKVDGAEYRFGESGEWSTENTLTGIAHDTEVTGYIRIAGDENHNPSTTNSLTLESGHGTLTYVERKEPDCENAGNKDYWYCESCRKCFSDCNGETEVWKEFVTIPAINHKWNQENYELDATHHWHNCQNENCPITDNSLKDGYGEHIDADGNGACDTCNLASYTIKLYNRTKDDANAIYDMPAVDRYFQGQEVTVTASDKSEDGYKFLGWYNVTKSTDTEATTYASAALTNKLKYTFTIEKDVRLVAVYQALGTAQVTINVVNGAEYYVGSDTLKKQGTTETVKLGSKLVLTAADSARVYQWQNESGKVLGTGSSLSLTVTGSTSVTLVYSTADKNVGYVQFVSDFGQVISATLCTESTAELLFPEGPSKFGYTFNYWTMDGTSEAKLADITSAIAVGSKLVTVTPFYSQNEMPKVSITVKKAYNGTSEDANDIVCSDLTYGSTMTIPEVSLEGYVFKCWSSDIAGTNVLSYDKEYFVQVTVNQTIYAIFVAPESEVKAQPVITITDLSTIEDGSTHKISCAATRNVPDGYSLIEQGMLYGVGLESLTKDTFVYGTENVKRCVSSDMAESGIFRLVYRLSSDTTVVYFRGYMIVKNNETGNQEYIYTDITKGSYNSIKNIQ